MGKKKWKDDELLPPIHPGEMLREEFLVPLKMKPRKLAKRMGVPKRRIKRLVQERGRLTPGMARKLDTYWKVSPGFWWRIEELYAADLERRESRRDMRGVRRY